jgi:hypothetical protein
MKTSGWCKALIGYVFIFVLGVFAAGCGGGGGDTPSSPGETLTAAEIDKIVHADAGLIVAVRVGELAILDGSGSATSLTAPLTYDWSFTSKPYGSNAVLQNATTVNPSFIADVTGTYMVQLVVSAGGISSQRAIASIEVTNEGDHLTGKRVHIRYPSRCADCHDGRYAVAVPPLDSIPGKSPDHLATSNACEACHTTFGFSLIRFADHKEVFGVCSDCHNNTIAIGKSEFHVETNTECDDCHTTTSFLELAPDGTFDHARITSGCVRCHNGTTAIGKHELHPATDSDCSFCHTTATFLNAYPDHSNSPDVVGNRCDSCHNATGGGFSASEIPAGHPVMAVDCGTCHGIKTFSMDGVFNHRLVDSSIQPCATCHNDNNSINARGKSSAINHVPTTEDCGVCHGVGGGNFADGIFDHTGIVDNCAECHGENGNGTGLGKPVNHLPTTADCSECHTPGTFTTGIFNHDPSVVDPVACTSCHNDVITAGKPVNHIPTTEDCRACHLNTTTFTGTAFNHLGIDVNNCTLCHDSNIAIGKMDNHIPTQDDCSVCHIDTNANGFASNATFLNAVHPGFTTGCQSCHVSRILPAASKPVIHVPTTRDCYTCHTNDVFVPSTFNHTGINSNCALCHDGLHDAAGAIGKPATHIATISDCGVCHNITTFMGGFVDHTGPDVVGNRCDSCHGVTTLGKHLTHIATTEDCGVCHVPGGTFTTAIFSHEGIVDNCASCHDGTTARGKPTSHVPTNSDCSQCHLTTGFMPGTFDHAGIVDNCVACHDGVFARGKIDGHVQTSADCGTCHTTRGFIPATFDHSTVSSSTRCDSCHGVTAIGKSLDHIATSLDCRSCHTTATFVGGTWVHDSSTIGVCKTCHSANGGATPQPTQGHISTDLQCDTCHSTNGWAPTSFSHDPQGNYPGDHRRATSCSACHGNIVTTPFVYPMAQYAPYCAACHANDFRRKGKHNGGENGTVEQNKDCSGGGRGCHRVTDSEF